MGLEPATFQLQPTDHAAPLHHHDEFNETVEEYIKEKYRRQLVVEVFHHLIQFLYCVTVNYTYNEIILREIPHIFSFFVYLLFPSTQQGSLHSKVL